MKTPGLAAAEVQGPGSHPPGSPVTPETFPAAADVARYGNLVLQAWAPPAHESLADDWVDSATRALLAGPGQVFLLGHRPSALAKLPPGAVSTEIARLSSCLTGEPRRGPLHRIPRDAAMASAALLRPGDLAVRQRRLDESTGMTRVSLTHLGRVLVLSSPAALLDAIEALAQPAPLQLLLNVLNNPQAGLRQPDATWLRSIRNWTGEDIVVTWSGHTLCLLAGREALFDLRWRLLDRPPAPVRDA